MTPRALLLILALAAGGRADTGSPPDETARVVPFYLRQEASGAAVVGALDLDQGKLLWTVPLTIEKDEWASLSWHGHEVGVTIKRKEGYRTTFRNLLDGRTRLDVAGGWFYRVPCLHRLVLLEAQQEPARALDARSGDVLWSRTKASWGHVFLRGPSPYVVFNVEGRLAAVDILTGRERWTREVGNNANLYSGGERLWVHRREASVVVELDPDSGRDARTVDAGASISALNIDAGRLNLCLSDRVTSVRVSDLATLWTWKTAEAPTSVWGSESTIIVEHEERRKSILNARTGERTGVLEHQAYKSSSSSLSLEGVYVFEVGGHTEGPQARILNTSTGAVLWQANDADVYTSFRSRILAVRHGRELSRLNPRTGEAFWTVSTGPIRDTLFQRQRLVLIRERHAVALDAATGREIWRVELPLEASQAAFGWETPH